VDEAAPDGAASFIGDAPQRHLEPAQRLEDLLRVGIELRAELGEHTLEPPRVANVRPRPPGRERERRSNAEVVGDP
jgi:hypothetical protein